MSSESARIIHGRNVLFVLLVLTIAFVWIQLLVRYGWPRWEAYKNSRYDEMYDRDFADVDCSALPDDNWGPSGCRDELVGDICAHVRAWEENN